MSEQNAVQNEQMPEQIIAELRLKNAALEEELAELRSQMDWLKRQVFGRKTEQASVIMENGTQMVMFPELQTQKSEPKPEETVTVPAHKRKKKRTHDDWMSSLPVEETVHEEEHPVCEKCGSEMQEIGTEKAYDELIYVPGRFFVRRHMVKTYKCPKCGENPEMDAQNEDIEPCFIRRAEYPKPMMPGSFCSPQLLAHIIYEKYAKAVPLHRQEKDFHAKGIRILKATMSNWLCTAAEQWGMPIVQEMHRLLLKSPVIHADETVLQVLHEKDRKATAESRMWVYCNGKMNDRSLIIFEYQPTRSGEHAKKFLQGFSGYLVRDGFSGYHAVTGVVHCACWTHTRRYFVNAMPVDKAARSSSLAAKAVEYCDRIYHEEGLLSDLSAEKRQEERLAKVKPLLDGFFAWLETIQTSGHSKLAKAVQYALHEKPYLYTFLEDGNVPIDNNRAENAIRPFAVGRKNWLFSNTERGAKCSAVWHSIIAAAQANGLDTEKYLTELFSDPPRTILLPFQT